MVKNEDSKLQILGAIFLFFGIGAWLNSFVNHDLSQVFWMCYLSLIIIGVGTLKKNGYIVMSQIYILAIPLLVWDADFLFHLFTGSPLFGITDYFFVGGFNFGKFISLQHLFSVPLAIYAISLTGLKKRDAWKISLAQIIIVYFFVLLFTPSSANINCVFKSCLSIKFAFDYALIWFLVFFGMTLLSAFLINRFLLKKNFK